ncbi:MAG: twin-arginine translocase subunit TatC [Bryobacteraceae bacterium]
MSSEEQQEPKAPNGGEPSHPDTPDSGTPGEISYTPATDDTYGYHDDPYAPQAPEKSLEKPAEAPQETALVRTPPGGGGKLPPPPPPPDPDGEDEEGMLRMSFLEHLEELRHRLIYALVGLAVAFFGCVLFANELWLIVARPAAVALKNIGVPDGKLAMLSPMEGFSTIWVKVPMLVSIFVASPWLVYQVWAFIAPGLYKKERRWAVPFILSTAGLFITGGAFAYFIAFRYGLTFLLGIGKGLGVVPVVSITDYFDLLVNVTLGVGLVFETPVIIFFLTLLHIASPSFLMRHSRYAILAITIIAAVVTPTPDPFNMMLFAVPMCVLYFAGVFASYLLVLRREKKRFPWKPVLFTFAGIAIVIAGVIYLMLARYGFKLIGHWPYLTR